MTCERMNSTGGSVEESWPQQNPILVFRALMEGKAGGGARPGRGNRAGTERGNTGREAQRECVWVHVRL